MIVAIPFLYLIVSLKFGDSIGITWMNRILFSSGIFSMIIAWGGLTEAKKWSVNLEIFRLLFMGVSFVFVFYQLQLIDIMSWPSILIAMFVGISILYTSYKFRQTQLDGQKFELA